MSNTTTTNASDTIKGFAMIAKDTGSRYGAQWQKVDPYATTPDTEVEVASVTDWGRWICDGDAVARYIVRLDDGAVITFRMADQSPAIAKLAKKSCPKSRRGGRRHLSSSQAAVMIWAKESK
jgi:hypothetical protein